MISSAIYIILALFGLSFLIFIHEFGHYLMARRVGMRVETFSIGFGKPIYSWVKDGVKWQIGWLLFGGFVKIAGTDAGKDVDPYLIEDGFFGKGPWARIKVAFMGPLVNLLFAIVVFSLLWMAGGRVKNFSEFTSKIGWIDTKSELYEKGVRPGDEIASYDNYSFKGFKDHIIGPMTASGEVTVHGSLVDSQTNETTPFDYTIKTYPHPDLFNKSFVTAGILKSANYLIYDRFSNNLENPLIEGSPLKNSGIQYEDRIVWVDGEPIFSLEQFSEILNDNRVLVTVKRGDEIFLKRVPRILAKEIRPDIEFREELIDWQYEAGLNFKKYPDLYTIPYNISYDCVVENVLKFIDKEDKEEAFPKTTFSDIEKMLQKGDKIIAIQGKPITKSYELIRDLQTKSVNIIVQRDAFTVENILWTEADNHFFQNLDWEQLEKIYSSIGTETPVNQLGKLVKLKPVTPKRLSNFPMSEESINSLAIERKERRAQIENIEDVEKRSHLLRLIDEDENQLIVGVKLQDRKVNYNPKPFELFQNITLELCRTLKALVTGLLSPKFLLGPVGIVHMVQGTSQLGLKEALFWLGLISLNLGFLNLLPIPVIDGGTIVLSFFELISGRRINPKILEKIVAVFAILLISFFVYLTYHDILRLFGLF